MPIIFVGCQALRLARATIKTQEAKEMYRQPVADMVALLGRQIIESGWKPTIYKGDENWEMLGAELMQLIAHAIEKH